MKTVRFYDSKLKLVKALLFRSFHETEAPAAGFCSAFICGRSYTSVLKCAVKVLYQRRLIDWLRCAFVHSMELPDKNVSRIMLKP